MHRVGGRADLDLQAVHDGGKAAGRIDIAGNAAGGFSAGVGRAGLIDGRVTRRWRRRLARLPRQRFCALDEIDQRCHTARRFFQRILRLTDIVEQRV